MLTLTFTACDRTPDGVIPRSEMAPLMADIHTAESVVDTERRVFSSDSMRQVLKQSVLAAHGYDVAAFDSSLMYYGRNIDEYSKLYDDVIEILESRVASAEALAATEGSASSLAAGDMNVSIDGDSVDVWALPRSLTFSDASPVEIVPFGIPTDRYWERGDLYTLRGRFTGPAGAIGMSMAVEYMDGSVDHLSVRFLGDGWKEMTLPTDSARTARYVYGVITYPKGENRMLVPAVIDSISLHRTRFSPGHFRDPRMQSVGPRDTH